MTSARQELEQTHDTVPGAWWTQRFGWERGGFELNASEPLTRTLAPVPPLRPIHHCADYMIYLIDDAGCSKCDEYELTIHSNWE